jgi:hypothetical protein
MGRIQTGVDKLVALVKEKQRVSVDEAAKTLGVSKTIVQEWADFLEEEAIIEIKYSLAKTYLVDKKLSQGEAAAKERQFERQRETFVTKVDQSIGAIEHEGIGFEAFKKEFHTLKGELGTSLKAVQGELIKLQRFEKQKHVATKNINKERDRLRKVESEADKAIKREYKRYNDSLSAIAKQEKTLMLHKKQVHELVLSEEHVGSKITEYEKLLKAMRAKVRAENKSLGLDTKTLRELERNARSIRAEIGGIEKTRLRPLLALREEHEKKLRALEKQILQRANAERKHAKKPAGGSVAARRKLEEFFRRKKVIEHLLEAIESDKRALLGELEELEKRAEAYRVGKNAAKLEELRKKLSHLEKGKEKLHAHVQAFLKTIR